MWCQSHVELWIVVVRLYLLKLGPKKLAWSRDCEECEPVAVQTALSASSGNWLKNTGKRPRFQTTCGALMRTHCFKTESWVILLITEFKKKKKEMVTMAFALGEHRACSPNPWNKCPSSSCVEIPSLCPALRIFNSQAEIKISTLLGSHSCGTRGSLQQHWPYKEIFASGVPFTSTPVPHWTAQSSGWVWLFQAAIS